MDSRMYCDILAPLSKLLDGAGSAAGTILREVIVDRGLTDKFAAQLRYQLRAHSNVDETLQELTWILSNVALHCPPVLKAEVWSSPYSLIQCTRLVCQRQLCQGQDDEETPTILFACIATLRSVIETILHSLLRQI